MAENDTGYPSSSPSTLGKRSPTSSDWGCLGSYSSADQVTPSALTASPYQKSHGSKESLLHDLGQHAKTNAEPGELWLSAKENEDPWPVVICDEELLQTLLEGQARPGNARREDGSWYKGYGPGGGLAEQRCFPTMRLETAKLCWTPWKRLVPFDILNVKSIQESAKTLELVKAYAEAIEQYGRNDLTYWKDKVFAKQLSNADTLEPVEVNIGKDENTTKRKQQQSNPAAHQPAKVDSKTSKKRKIGKNGFKYPPRVIAGIKVWGGDDISDSGDEAVRDYKKIKLEHEMDGDLFLSSELHSQAPATQTSMVEEEDISAKQTLTATSSVTKKVKFEDEKDDDLFLSPASHSEASGRRASTSEEDSKLFEPLRRLQTPSERAKKAQTSASQASAQPTPKIKAESEPTARLSIDPDRLAEAIASTSSAILSSPRFVRTQNSPSRPFFEKIVSPTTATTQDSPSRPPFERFISPGEPYCSNQPTLRDTFTEYTAKRSARLLSPTPQQSQASTPHTPANSSIPPPQPSTVVLYIGSPPQIFSVNASALRLSSHLHTKFSYDPTMGPYVTSPLLARIEPQDFEPVASYLKGLSDAQACICTTSPVIDGTNPGDASAEAFRRAAMTFHIAAQLGLIQLTIAAVHRLAEIRVEPTSGFLHMIAHLLRQGVLAKGALRGFLVRCLAEWFWELFISEGGMLREVLVFNRGFMDEVVGGLGAVIGGGGALVRWEESEGWGKWEGEGEGEGE